METIAMDQNIKKEFRTNSEKIILLQNVITNFSDIRCFDDLKTSRRDRSLVYARMIYSKLCYEFELYNSRLSIKNDKKSTYIGKDIGRDRSSIYNYIKKHDDFIRYDDYEVFYEKVKKEYFLLHGLEEKIISVAVENAEIIFNQAGISIDDDYYQIFLFKMQLDIYKQLKNFFKKYK
jgi:hypothetical protein